MLINLLIGFIYERPITAMELLIWMGRKPFGVLLLAFYQYANTK